MLDIRFGLITIIIRFRNDSINMLDLASNFDPAFTFVPTCADNASFGLVDPELDAFRQAFRVGAN